MNGNDFLELMLKSPLHGFMGNTLLITVTGRKTGRKIAVPVNYYRVMDELWVLTTRSRQWWRNVNGGAEVDLVLNGKKLKGFAEAILDRSAVAARLGDYVRSLPMSAGVLGVGMEHGVPNREDTARVAEERLFVKICLTP
jgi:hypothetical protein